jgi:hypothetical protein
MRKTTKKLVAALSVAVFAVLGVVPSTEAATTQKPATHWCC